MNKAIILCGGFGTRLRSVVSDRPKPMADINDYPFLEFLIKALKRHGIKEFVLAISYLPEQIKDHFKDGSSLGVKIQYAIEETALGTAGAIKNCQQFLNEKDNFFVFNGDTFLNVDVSEFAQFCNQKQSDLGIVLRRFKDISSKGEVKVDDNANILSFEEKQPEHRPGLINGGIYFLNYKILKEIPENKKVSIESEIFPKLLQKGYRLIGFESDAYFIDIGTPDEYSRARKELAQFI